MDSAKCQEDGLEYTGEKFAKLSAGEIASKRRRLVCVKCGTKAIYVKQAKSGQGPHFRARPHTNCSLAAPEAERGPGGGNDKDVLFNPGDHIVLDLRFGAAEGNHGDGEDGGDEGGSGGRHTGQGGPSRAFSRRRLRPLLKLLIYSEAFRRSTQTIELPEVGVFDVASFFVNFSDVTDEHVGEFFGFWGDIQDIGQGANASRWINTGDRDNVSVVIDHGISKAFLSQHRATWEQLEGMSFLVFGKLGRSKNDKLWIKPKGVEFTATYDGS